MKNVFKHMRGLIFAYLNIRSLWPQYDEMKLYVMENKISCLSISETWLHAAFSDNLVNIPGYILIRHDRQTKKTNTDNIKKGGGLAVYVKQDIY